MQKLTFLEFEKLKPMWPLEEESKILNLLNLKHAHNLQNEHFEIECGYNQEFIQIKFSLRKSDNSFFYPLEILCLYQDYTHLKIHEIANIIIDYIDHYWEQYFSEERCLFLPIDWNSYECEGVKFFLRGFVRNLNLELQADQFLKQYGHGEYEISPISSES